MGRPWTSLLALFLAIACPVVCRASMAFAGVFDAGGQITCAAEPCGGCASQEEEPCGPIEPCEGAACFCSVFIAEHGSDLGKACPTGSLAIGSASASPLTCIAATAHEAAARARSFGPTAEQRASLPLLI